MVTIYIPTPFRRHAGGEARVAIPARTVGEALAALIDRYPALRPHLLDADGDVLQHVNVFVGDTEVHDLQGRATVVKDGDRISLIPAMAGGEEAPFTEEQIVRYSRHILLGEVGGEGQLKLLQSKVLVIGAGGLGSPASLYLAAAGVGTIGIVDGDVVDLSNLQRQILHDQSDIGRLKVESAAETIGRLNPDVKVVPYPTVIDSSNALEIIQDYDVVVNGCDNFPTRYLLNDACVFLQKPLVDGSILRFEGQASVYMPGTGCYRCLFPAPPPPGSVPSCAEAGVIGALPGIVGSIQALEAVKVLLGIGETLAGHLLFFNALGMEFRKLRVRRNPNCPVCGDDPSVTELIDYHQFCGLPRPAAGQARHG